MDVPVVAATRFEGYVGERYLVLADTSQVAIALEIFGVGSVRLADRENHLALEGCLGIVALHVVCPNFLCQAKGCPRLWPSGIEGDVGDDLGCLGTGDAVLLGSHEVILQ